MGENPRPLTWEYVDPLDARLFYGFGGELVRVEQRIKEGGVSERLQAELRLSDRELDEAHRQLDELRAILQPLLDKPFRTITDYGDTLRADDEMGECLFCGQDDWTNPHKPDCPVLNRDRLLGRAPSGTG
ncbi:MAG TPA: hypothetical protein VD926_10900 [Acidimicrobiales bacterium]|nr:hypothetical protein [Acidimicrobiales bacterium]